MFDHLSLYFPIATPEYVQVGCFKDNVRQRALPELLVSFRGNIDWKRGYITKKKFILDNRLHTSNSIDEV